MQILLRVILVSIVVATSSCTKAGPDEVRATHILNEINELNRKPYNENFNEVVDAMGRLHNVRENFPNGRDSAEGDVRLVQTFFTASIGEHKYIIALLRELSSIRVSDDDAECITTAIKMQSSQIESAGSTMGQISLLLDQSIEDKTSLESKLEPLIKKGQAADQNFNELTVEQKRECRDLLLAR